MYQWNKRAEGRTLPTTGFKISTLLVSCNGDEHGNALQFSGISSAESPYVELKGNRNH